MNPLKANDKYSLLEFLLSQMERNLELLISAAQKAKKGATDEESLAENKYDTRGLELSYLAGAQSRRAKKLEESIFIVKQLLQGDLSQQQNVVKLNSLVQVVVNEEEHKIFFILSVGGGHKIAFKDSEVFILTPESPLGVKLMGRLVNDEFEWSRSGEDADYIITAVT